MTDSNRLTLDLNLGKNIYIAKHCPFLKLRLSEANPGIKVYQSSFSAHKGKLHSKHPFLIYTIYLPTITFLHYTSNLEKTEPS